MKNDYSLYAVKIEKENKQMDAVLLQQNKRLSIRDIAIGDVVYSTDKKYVGIVIDVYNNSLIVRRGFRDNIVLSFAQDNIEVYNDSNNTMKNCKATPKQKDLINRICNALGKNYPKGLTKYEATEFINKHIDAFNNYQSEKERDRIRREAEYEAFANEW